MKSATISEARNTLSALLDRVRNGETILITDRHRPVARLEPAAGTDEPGADEGRLSRLERSGVIRRAEQPPLREILDAPPPAPLPGGDAVAMVVAERRSGR
jgi:prevent-host-death family protein